MLVEPLHARLSSFLSKWSPFRLRKQMKLIAEERERHAYSVRQLIAQRSRLFELIEFAGRIAHFDNGEPFRLVSKQFRES